MRFQLEAKNVVREYRLRKAREDCKGNKRETIFVSIRRLKLLGTHLSSVPIRRFLQRMLKASGRPVSVVARDWTMILHAKMHPCRAALCVFEIDDTSCEMKSEGIVTQDNVNAGRCQAQRLRDSFLQFGAQTKFCTKERHHQIEIPTKEPVILHKLEIRYSDLSSSATRTYAKKKRSQQTLTPSQSRSSSCTHAPLLGPRLDA